MINYYYIKMGKNKKGKGKNRLDTYYHLAK